MEEQEYKAAYNEIANIRCVFEKTLTNNHARCSCARHFWLADREGYACGSDSASAQCRELLGRLRAKSRFVLKLPDTAAPLPHNMELRVQVGGLQGLRSLFEPGAGGLIEDIRSLVRQAGNTTGDFTTLPYEQVVQSVARFSVRKRKIRG